MQQFTEAFIQFYLASRSRANVFLKLNCRLNKMQFRAVLRHVTHMRSLQILKIIQSSLIYELSEQRYSYRKTEVLSFIV